MKLWRISGLVAAMLLSATCSAFAAPPSSMPDFTDDFASGSLASWGGMGERCVIAPHGGRNDGAGALAANGVKGSGLSRSFPAVPGTYEYIFWAKPVDVKGEIGVRGGVEFYDKDGKFVHPYFYETLTGKPDAFGWYKTIVRVPRVPERAARIQIFCQLAPGSTGQVFFDDISFKPAVSPLLVSMVRPLNQTAAPGDEVKLLLTRANGELLSAEGVTARVTGPVGFPEQKAPVLGGRFSFTMPEMEDGPCPLAIELESAPADAVPKRLSLPLNAMRRQRLVSFDSLGRMSVDGRPFMPLGFYTSSGFGTNITDRLLECGANTVLSYCTFGGLGNGVDEMWRNLVRLNGMGIKTIFAINNVFPGIQWSRTSFDGAEGCDAVVDKVMKALKDAPGLLAWYLNDELSFADMLVERRDRIAALDPDHPAFIEVYQPEVASAYMRTTDIFGVCCYPVGTLPPAKTSMAMDVSEEHAAAFGREGNPVWAIPQCHNAVAYGKEGARPPTEEEMRTVALHFAGLGAKAFIFYNLTDLWSKKQKPDGKTAFAEHWPRVCRVFAFLKSFEPWIMGATPVERIGNDKFISANGDVRAFLFRDDAGRRRVVFVAGGPGKSEIRLALRGNWRSRFGRTVQRDEEMVFTGEGISSDVLEELDKED